jgi:hypothetical protein
MVMNRWPLLCWLTLASACNGRDHGGADTSDTSLGPTISQGFNPPGRSSLHVTQSTIAGPWSEVDTTVHGQCLRAPGGAVTCSNGRHANLPALEQIDLRSASESAGCGIDMNHAVVCWLDDQDAFRTFAATDGFAQVSVSGDTVVALSLAGALWSATGNNPLAMIDAGPFSMVAASGWTWCGVRSSGEVQCGDEDCPSSSSACSPPSGSFVSITGDAEEFCAIADDGGLSCWGPYSLFELGGTFEEVAVGGVIRCAVTDTDIVRCRSEPGYQVSPPSAVRHLDIDAIVDPDTNEILGSVCGLTADANANCWNYYFQGANFQ